MSEIEKKKRKTPRKKPAMPSAAKADENATGADRRSLDVESSESQDSPENDEIISPDGSPVPKRDPTPLY